MKTSGRGRVVVVVCASVVVLVAPGVAASAPTGDPRPWTQVVALTVGSPERPVDSHLLVFDRDGRELQRLDLRIDDREGRIEHVVGDVVVVHFDDAPVAEAIDLGSSEVVEYPVGGSHIEATAPGVVVSFGHFGFELETVANVLTGRSYLVADVAAELGFEEFSPRGIVTASDGSAVAINSAGEQRRSFVMPLVGAPPFAYDAEVLALSQDLVVTGEFDAVSLMTLNWYSRADLYGRLLVDSTHLTDVARPVVLSDGRVFYLDWQGVLHEVAPGEESHVVADLGIDIDRFVALLTANDSDRLVVTTETSLQILDLDGRPVGKAIETTAQRLVVPVSLALPRCALVLDDDGGRLIDTATGAVFPAVVGSTTMASSSDGCVRPVSDDISMSAGDRLVTRDGIIVLPEGYEVRAVAPDGSAAVVVNESGAHLIDVTATDEPWVSLDVGAAAADFAFA